MATLTRLSGKELVGGQINAGKFFYRPVLKGQQTDALIFASVSYSSSMAAKILKILAISISDDPFVRNTHPEGTRVRAK